MMLAIPRGVHLNGEADRGLADVVTDLGIEGIGRSIRMEADKGVHLP